MLEAIFVICPWHGCTASHCLNLRAGKLTNTTKFCSAEHSVWFEVTVDDENIFTTWLVTQVFLGPSLLKGPVQLFTFCKNCPLQASINDPLPVFYAIALAIFQESKEEECIIKMIQRSFAIMVKMLQRGIIFKG